MRDELTNRQNLLAELVGQALSNKHIANRLNISESAVKQMLSKIFAKLKVRNRTELAILAHAKIGLYDHDRYDR